MVWRAHASHDKSSASQLPEHDEHVRDPGGENVPPAQGEHIAAPSEEKVPVQRYKIEREISDEHIAREGTAKKGWGTM